MSVDVDDMYFITLSADGIGDVKVLLGDQPPALGGGYGGWTVQARLRRIGLTVWNGKDPLQMNIPVLFDGFVSGESQEIPISRLSRMALPPTTGGEPPVITVTGRGIPKPGPNQWVIQNLQWGTNIIRDFAPNGVMVRLRQDCVINLIQYVGEDRVAFKGLRPGKVAKTGKSKSGWPKTYTVKSGDTLRKIAIKFYKNAAKWKKIADANNIRDPAVVSSGKYTGKKLRIPAP